MHVQVMALRPTGTDTYLEEPAPAELADNSVTVIYTRGSTYFAAARTIQELLPSAKEAKRAVVIIRMRGVDQVGTTMIAVAERYARELHANGGRLMLSGVHETVLEQLRRTETTDDIPEEAIYMATAVIGESTRAAMAGAQEWLASEEEAGETAAVEPEDASDQNPVSE